MGGPDNEDINMNCLFFFFRLSFLVFQSFSTQICRVTSEGRLMRPKSDAGRFFSFGSVFRRSQYVPQVERKHALLSELSATISTWCASCLLVDPRGASHLPGTLCCFWRRSLYPISISHFCRGISRVTMVSAWREFTELKYRYMPVLDCTSFISQPCILTKVLIQCPLAPSNNW